MKNKSSFHDLTQPLEKQYSYQVKVFTSLHTENKNYSVILKFHNAYSLSPVKTSLMLIWTK